MTTLGSDVYACVFNGDIYKQTDGTGDFVALGQTTRNWSGMTTLGSDVYACVFNGDIYKQTDGTGDFVALGQTTRNWRGMTTLGSDVYACVNGGDIYKQTDGTGDFVALGQTPRNWSGMTTLGESIYACVYNGDIYKQSPTKALEVYSTAETLTNQTYLGYPVYRKVINFGVLPNASAKFVAHGVKGDFTVRNIYISVKSSAQNVQSSFFGLQQDDSISRQGDNVVFHTTQNRSAYTGYVIMEYIKADL